MWHTGRTFLRKPDDGDGVGLIADLGIGLAQIDALFFTLEKRLPEEHLKANENLNLEL